MNFRFACLLTLPAALTFANCQKTPSEPAPTAATCATPATVRDLTGLGGCGKVLVLGSGYNPSALPSKPSAPPRANKC